MKEPEKACDARRTWPEVAAADRRAGEGNEGRGGTRKAGQPSARERSFQGPGLQGHLNTSHDSLEA